MRMQVNDAHRSCLHTCLQEFAISCVCTALMSKRAGMHCLQCDAWIGTDAPLTPFPLSLTFFLSLSLPLHTCFCAPSTSFAHTTLCAMASRDPSRRVPHRQGCVPVCRRLHHQAGYKPGQQWDDVYSRPGHQLLSGRDNCPQQSGSEPCVWAGHESAGHLPDSATGESCTCVSSYVVVCETVSGLGKWGGAALSQVGVCGGRAWRRSGVRRKGGCRCAPTGVQESEVQGVHMHEHAYMQGTNSMRPAAALLPGKQLQPASPGVTKCITLVCWAGLVLYAQWLLRIHIFPQHTRHTSGPQLLLLHKRIASVPVRTHTPSQHAPHAHACMCAVRKAADLPGEQSERCRIC